jgi:hypothetical protein
VQDIFLKARDFQHCIHPLAEPAYKAAMEALIQAARLNNDAKHIREILEGAIRTAGIIHDRMYSFQLQYSPND